MILRILTVRLSLQHRTEILFEDRNFFWKVEILFEDFLVTKFVIQIEILSEDETFWSKTDILFEVRNILLKSKFYAKIEIFWPTIINVNIGTFG